MQGTRRASTQWLESSRLLPLRALLEWVFFDMVVRLGAAEWESHQGGWLGHSGHLPSQLTYTQQAAASSGAQPRVRATLAEYGSLSDHLSCP